MSVSTAESIEHRVTELVLKIFADRKISKESGDLGRDVPLYGGGGAGLDSMDMAVLSAHLEKTFGSDPFSRGQFARTIGEIADFYAAQAAS